MLYKTIRNKGLIQFNDTLLHKIRIAVEDKSGNSSNISFQAKRSISYKKGSEQNTIDNSKILRWYKRIM